MATSTRPAAATMITAARALSGISASRPGVATSRVATPTAPTSPTIWVRAPASLATAERVALADTGKPWKRPAIRLAPPMATISRSGSTWSPVTPASVDDTAMVSASEMRTMPTAAVIRGTRSSTGTHGRVRPGRPCGRVPRTGTPWPAPSKTTLATVAATTASNTPGTRGHQWRTARMTSTVPAPKAKAQGSNSSRWRTNAPASPSAPSLPLEKPQRAGSWLTMITRARPFRNPMRTGFDNRVATKPTRPMPSSTSRPPTSRPSMPARATAAAGSSVLTSGTIAAKTRGDTALSGPTINRRDGPIRA